MEVTIPNGKAYAIRIKVAEELGLNPEYTTLADMYLQGSLFVSMYGRLELAAKQALKLITDSGLEKEAYVLCEKYL